MVTPNLVAVSLPATTMIMADDLLQSDRSWYHVDSLLNLPSSLDEESTAVEPSFTAQNSKPSNCTCNSTAGPCSSHLDIMRAQIMAETQMDLTLPPSSTLFTSFAGPSVPFSRNDFASGPASDIPSITSGSPSAQAKLQSDSTTSTPTTTKLDIVLDSINQAGFRDFEEVVLAYYTSQFERGSVPAMLQYVSRSRRLKTLLHELQKSSSQWTRWESRGLHESVSEAAVSLCVDEVERVFQAPVHTPSQNDTAHLISAFEWLLRDQGCSDQTNSRTTERPTLFEQIETAPDSVGRLIAVPTRKLTRLIDATSLVTAD